MSVFKILKGTFQNVQQDIVDGLRTLTSSDQPKHEQLSKIKNNEINLNIGADLLFGYQKVWSIIQADTKESAKKAEEVSILLQPMFHIWDKCGESVSQLEDEVKHIPNIHKTLDDLQKLLDCLRQDFAQAEKGLEFLENLCEEQELRNKFVAEQKKLAAYRIKKEDEAEKVKVELAQNHAKKMIKLEALKKNNLQERANAFTSAFQEDLEYYRKHGPPDRIVTEFPKVSSLSEIVIDEDKQELDSFLGPPDHTQELPGDNAYFEDDYLGDFSVKDDVDDLDMDYISSTMVETMVIEGDTDDHADSPLTRSFESAKVAADNIMDSYGTLDNKYRTLTTTSDSSGHENDIPEACVTETIETEANQTSNNYLKVETKPELQDKSLEDER